VKSTLPSDIGRRYSDGNYEKPSPYPIVESVFKKQDEFGMDKKKYFRKI
jgi:hypothetical protein